ncbi:ABC transporter permease [Aerococcus sp. UMB10185]|uniref:ABC transporter permease n=1 Tax=unclassified Aerococcus TaxID=2618060 RepID=UPI0008A1EB56|nr:MULTISPECIES: branched-chain amino acid ABC transporter permease [unclassified Aerococcus]MDK6233609.1 ABC transporter permease [Aerococcus sp. UMB10185]MDK6855708.1 ABC transporter permease [Aerococcus sp. UMB7533]MDK8501461.1 ABC transporter permease [Aerococcus sp. UMB1112A]OFN01523.1 branched-chain amino acid ABC transporter permease [Aerococcus sp. HMSC062A02]OHO46411.1 branched-chain amino acid ABC transporter permease [Aerococcus sp. HMSC035B07]
MDMIISALSQGVIWAVMGLGIYISFRILNAPDMTTEASFTLGAAIGVQMIHFGLNPILALLIGFLAGMAAGAITALLVTKLDINPLLSGIITMTGLYSINLKMMGQANLSLSGQETFKTMLSGLALPRNVDTILIGTVVVAIVIALMAYFFKTDLGQALIATGDNVHMARAVGIDSNEMTMLGYMLANGLIAASGLLVATDNGYADISMGIGTVVIGLASIIIGEVIFKNVSLTTRFITIVAGSIIYRLLLSLVLMLNFNADDFKLFSAIIVGLCLAIPKLRKSFNRSSRQSRKG